MQNTSFAASPLGGLVSSARRTFLRRDDSHGGQKRMSQSQFPGTFRSVGQRRLLTKDGRRSMRNLSNTGKRWRRPGRLRIIFLVFGSGRIIKRDESDNKCQRISWGVFDSLLKEPKLVWLMIYRNLTSTTAMFRNRWPVSAVFGRFEASPSRSIPCGG